MGIWIANGAALAWLIDPEERNIDIYRPGSFEEKIENFKGSLKGDGPVDGFVLDLSRFPA